MVLAVPREPLTHRAGIERTAETEGPAKYLQERPHVTKQKVHSEPRSEKSRKEKGKHGLRIIFLKRTKDYVGRRTLHKINRSNELNPCVLCSA